MCTLEKRRNLFILTLTGDNKYEHRLNPALISSIRSALAEARSQAVAGSVLITVAQGRFFSNGFDLRYAQSVGAKSGSIQASLDEVIRMVNLFKGVVSDFLTLPMPTVAAVGGHAAAAGLMLAMSHDYITMTSSRSVMYMSELDIGMTLPDYFTALIRAKIGSASARRNLMLRAAKVKADEAVKMGIVDSAHASPEEAVEAAMRLCDDLTKKKWNGKVYAEIRKASYPELCGLLGLKDEEILPSKL
ncbi:enoyl- delta isomerase 2, peroxisomal-like [Olea europaea subsp. europaea]|uniref:Delta(3)-Delta(2)-enoyl-CoA isomerase n=1 Tax=Olea europaea subsp. europaea TaxID=158383 RepID=A0A8S0UVV9_OLEEU|nr:enoyl- delta isomerase 2, peroxisomal-like [Olea europaea subsp. europaea]